MGGEPTVLGMIHESVKRIEKKQDEITKCVTQNKMDINELKLGQKVTEEAFVRHVQNEEKHFQPYFNETLRQKLWRKKVEIAAGGGVGAGAITIIALLLKILEVINW